ncbi:hypothetical protein ACFQY7_37825 [Actinomadura luteofluorescens]|uniref:hypothetical protein n=1 Tax=Actinomadura luteofluorescens TaxID=46163 RepID=UPI00362FFA85
MPTNNHELPLEMVRNRPQLVPEMLRTVFGLDVSGQARATLASESYADTNPAELRCDATVLLGDPKSPVMGIVVESQLRVLKQKSYSWPAYLASLRAPAHADGPQSEAVLQGLSAAIGSLSGDTGKLYYDYVLSRFSDAARKLMEETVKLDNYEWQSEFAITHRAEGRAEGLAEGEARGRPRGRPRGRSGPSC